MSQKENEYIEIKTKELELESYKKRILLKYGWQEKCGFPDACWRWCKKVNGDLMTLSIKDALRIEFLHSD